MRGGTWAECLVSGGFISPYARQAPSDLAHFFFFFYLVRFLPLASSSAGLKAISPALTRGTRSELFFVLIPHDAL